MPNKNFDVVQQGHFDRAGNRFVERVSERKYAIHNVDTDRSYTGRYVTVFEDEETGIVTADPWKFEAWLKKS